MKTSGKILLVKKTCIKKQIKNLFRNSLPKLKDNISILLNFQKFINIILDFEKGKIKYFFFSEFKSKKS